MARTILIVANETAAGEHLHDAVVEEMSKGDVEFHLAVPASPPKEGIVWTEGEAEAHAKDRLDEALEKLSKTGATLKGWVADPSPMHAIRQALEESSYERIIISTFPPGISRWLAMDLPHRVQRDFGIEVTHLIAKDSRLREGIWSG